MAEYASSSAAVALDPDRTASDLASIWAATLALTGCGGACPYWSSPEHAFELGSGGSSAAKESVTVLRH